MILTTALVLNARIRGSAVTRCSAVLVLGILHQILLICLFSSAARLLFQFNTAKLVNIIRITKYFDKNFQNIFMYFFSLCPGKKFFLPREPYFSNF